MNLSTPQVIEVLVVEDDPFVRESIQIYLETEGFQVRTAKDGLVGLERIREQEPDVALIDLRMPRMDGIELLRHIKESYSEIEVLMASGAATLESALDAMKLGAYSYIEKPIVDLENDLKNVILKAAERRRLRSTNLQLQGDLQRARYQVENLERGSQQSGTSSKLSRWLRAGARSPLQDWREKLFDEMAAENVILYLRQNDRLLPAYSRNSAIDIELETLSTQRFPDPGESCREVNRPGLFPESDQVLLFPLYLFGRLEGLLAVPDRPTGPLRENWKASIREFGDLAAVHICAIMGTTSTTTG
ncbi:MAG: response regulator [Planctomycetia bacterium]|nr:response regulator [Planctomycetia bacterium]